MLATIGIPRCEKISTRLVPWRRDEKWKSYLTGKFSVGTIVGSANAIGQVVRQIIDTARILLDHWETLAPTYNIYLEFYWNIKTLYIANTHRINYYYQPVIWPSPLIISWNRVGYVLTIQFIYSCFTCAQPSLINCIAVGSSKCGNFLVYAFGGCQQFSIILRSGEPETLK
jgi:hypothetical protein